MDCRERGGAAAALEPSRRGSGVVLLSGRHHGDRRGCDPARSTLEGLRQAPVLAGNRFAADGRIRRIDRRFPGPNAIGYYFAFRVVGHFFSVRGARRALDVVQWTNVPSAPLDRVTSGDRSRAGPAARIRRARRLEPSSGPPAELLSAYRSQKHIADMKLHALAERLGCRLEGNGELDITRVAGIESAGPSELTFFANSKYARRTSRDPCRRGDPGRAGRSGAVRHAADEESVPGVRQGR